MDVKRIWIIWLTAVICITACRPKPLDIHVGPAETKLVISSQIIPGSIMLVSVTRSFSALAIDAETDTVSEDFLDDIVVDSALVVVSYRDQSDTLFMISEGIFASVTTLQYPLETYHIYVYDSTTGLEAWASTTMMPFVPFDTIYPEKIDVNGDTAIYFNYRIQDPPQENYYVISYISQLSDSDAVGLDINNYFSSGSNLLVYTELVTDKAFPGAVIEGRTEVEGIDPADSVVVTLSNITREYFEFLDARRRAEGIVAQITQEPINYPSNVINGYGFFNAHYPDIRYFDLRRY